MATVQKTIPVKTISSLAHERRARAESLRQRWALLVHKAARGEELSVGDVDTLGEAAEVLGIEDIEEAFNSDCDAVRWVDANQKAVEDIRAERLPERMEQLAAELERLQAEMNRVRGLHSAARHRHQSYPVMQREVNDKRAANPRIYGGANNAN